MFRSRDGRDIPVWQAIVAHRSSAGQVLYFSTIARDITDRKQAEAAGREAARRKDEFLAMLAHELRNPLAPIGNAVHILKLGGLDEARLEWCREVIDRQVEHMSRLVDDLLDVSRISRGKIELKKAPLAVAEVVQRAVETSRPLLDARRHVLSLHVPEDAVYVEGDLVRLAQVLSNLLNNAAKYTDEGGRVQLTVEASGGDVFLRVRDNGRGIDPSVLSSLFDLFYQADRSIDRSEGGLGIGLSLVRSLVAMHGGDVRVYSEGRGKGSEFVVRLPRLPELPSAAAAKGAELPPAEEKLRILVVDDNRDAAESLAMLLGIEGHAVSLAYDGPTALEVALAECPDAVLLDIGLPGMDGYAVARALRRQAGLETTRLIAVSGYGQAEDREKAKIAGFDGFLTKPVHPPELLAALTLRA
ncbi:MAG TPA: ATP-binding protein [Methylococcaceae bacterium]|nr:ATP-binding protein [Methylococcaceae bacterium]